MRKTNRSSWKGCGLAPGILAFFLILAACSPESSEIPKAAIRLSGNAVFPITPDSCLADPLKAPDASFTSFTITVAPARALKPGGGIRMEPGFLFQGRPLTGDDVRYTFTGIQMDDAEAPNFLIIDAGGVHFRSRPVPDRQEGTAFEAIFPQGLPAGKEVKFRFGETSGGSPGLAVPVWPMKSRLLTFIDCEGDGDFFLADGDHPEVEAFAAGVDRFSVTAPSVTFEPMIRMRIVPMRGEPGPQQSALPVCDYEGEVRVFLDAEGTDPAGTGLFDRGDRFLDLSVELPEPGCYWLMVRGKGDGLSGESNPVYFIDSGRDTGKEKAVAAREPDPTDYFIDRSNGIRIFWGSLQNHTAVGGHAASTPDQAYRCAKQEGALDFCAVTDHSSNGSFHWETLRGFSDAYDEPARFTAFAGYEWTSSPFGHRHVVLKEGKDSQACSELPTDDPAEIYAPDLATFARYAGRDPNALVIMHHTKRRLDPSVDRFMFGDSTALPRQLLFEIFSYQGDGEGAPDDQPIQGREDRTYPKGSGFRDALQAGYRFGVTGDSDAHFGRPGVAMALLISAGLAAIGGITLRPGRKPPALMRYCCAILLAV
ncbi:MAG: DUF3604 domain-containing protein, partial [Planctomycetes bacterium]|nr:DUF3604 domain-containing protein [Planctomycetota bacterium]